MPRESRYTLSEIVLVSYPHSPICRPEKTNGGQKMNYSPAPLVKGSPRLKFEPSQSTYLDNRVLNVTTQQTDAPPTYPERRKIKPKFKPGFEKLSEKTKSKNKLAGLFRDVGAVDLASKMFDCSAFFYVTKTDRCIQRTEETFHCGSRHCAFCAAIKAQRKLNNYLPKAEAYFEQNIHVTPIHLVLTQKHYRKEVLIKSVNRILKSFRALIRRAFWKNHCKDGGIYAVEYTLGHDNCWHAHIHLLVFRRRFFDVRAFRREWLDVTGDSKNIRVRLIDTLGGGLEEIIGYIGKPADVSRFTTNHAQQILKLNGVKMFGTFGDFRKFCADFKPIEAEAETKEKAEAGGVCACHGLPLVRVKLAIGERIEFERELYERRQRLKNPPT